VGSIHESVIEGHSGFLVQPGNTDQFAERLLHLLREPLVCGTMGAAARELVVRRWSSEAMVHGYERLIESTYARKTSAALAGIA
jgi:glycosyltransferase involved in cell wall biosynthesis